MIYTFPHYYNHFKCTASGCPDTCCAGWGIMIDSASLKKYRDMDGPFGSRLHNSIHWKEGSFKQYHATSTVRPGRSPCAVPAAHIPGI